MAQPPAKSLLPALLIWGTGRTCDLLPPKKYGFGETELLRVLWKSIAKLKFPPAFRYKARSLHLRSGEDLYYLEATAATIRGKHSTWLYGVRSAVTKRYSSPSSHRPQNVFHLVINVITESFPSSRRERNVFPLLTTGNISTCHCNSIFVIIFCYGIRSTQLRFTFKYRSTDAKDSHLGNNVSPSGIDIWLSKRQVSRIDH